MNWIIRALMRAAVAGVGWKLGSDAYDAIKRRLNRNGDDLATDSEENGAGATQTHTVDASRRPPRNP